MSNAILGWPIYSDVGVTYTPALSGGSWVAGLPLTNLQDRALAKVARSADAAVTSTLFDVDLGVARALRVLALVGHNLSSAAKVRFRLWSAVPVLDVLDFGTGWTDVNTPTLSAAAFTCADGIPLDLLGDNNGAAEEYKHRTVPFTGNGERVISFRVKAGTSPAATGAAVRIYDATAAATRLAIGLTSSGSVVTAAIGGGLGTVLATTMLETGVYRVVAKTTSGLLAANTNRIEASGAGVSAEQGDIYLGDFMAWDAATDQLVYDTGRDDAWPSGIDAEEYAGYTRTVLAVPSAAQTARYARVNLVDTGNSDGYVQVGRLVLAGGWEPTINFAPGQKLGFDTSTSEEETDGGAIIVRERANRRTAVMTFQDLPKDEALANALDMQAQLGRAGQLFAVLDPDDTTNLHRQSFLARLKELSPLEHPYYHRRQVPLALMEDL